MLKTITLAVAAATLAGCASDAQWAASDPRNAAYITQGQVVGAMNPSDAMADSCRRKRTGQSPMTPAWDAYCKGRGL